MLAGFTQICFDMFTPRILGFPMIQFDEFAHIFSHWGWLVKSNPPTRGPRAPIGRFSRRPPGPLPRDVPPSRLPKQVAKALGGEIFTFDGGHDVPMDEVPTKSSCRDRLVVVFVSVRKPRNVCVCML